MLCIEKKIPKISGFKRKEFDVDIYSEFLNNSAQIIIKKFYYWLKYEKKQEITEAIN